MAMCYSNKFHSSSVSNVADFGSFWTIWIILNGKTGIFMQNIYIDVENIISFCEESFWLLNFVDKIKKNIGKSLFFPKIKQKAI